MHGCHRRGQLVKYAEEESSVEFQRHATVHSHGPRTNKCCSGDHVLDEVGLAPHQQRAPPVKLLVAQEGTKDDVEVLGRHLCEASGEKLAQLGKHSSGHTQAR